MNTNNTISSEFDSFLVEIRDECHIATARRAAKSLAESIGFSERLTCHITTSVSELATNLYLHTEKGGSIKLSALDHKGKKGIELHSNDFGPGIEDVELAMQDGFSTNGGLGGGLPGTQRLMDEFEISSSRNTGTSIVARKWLT